MVNCRWCGKNISTYVESWIKAKQFVIKCPYCGRKNYICQYCKALYKNPGALEAHELKERRIRKERIAAIKKIPFGLGSLLGRGIKGAGKGIGKGVVKGLSYADDTKIDIDVVWLIFKTIGIFLFLGLIGYFSFFGYQGYKLGAFSGVVLLMIILADLFLLFLFFLFLSKKRPATAGGWLKLILILIIIIAAIYGLWYLGKVGVYTKAGIQLEKIMIVDRIKMSFSSIKENFMNYIYSFGAWEAPETIEKGKPVGIEIESFAPRRSYFRAGRDEISTIAIVKVYGFPDRDIRVTFDCDMGGIKPKSEMGVIVTGGSNPIKVSRGQEFSIYQVMCIFDPIEEIPEEGESIVKKVSLTAKYEGFATISKLRVYTMEKSEVESLEMSGQNPFEFYSIEDPLITEERKSIPVQDRNTPVELWLNIPLMQPLTISEFYTLGFKFKHNKVRWGGTVDKISKINFEFPQGFEAKGLDYVNEQLEKNVNEKLIQGEELTEDTQYIDFSIREIEPKLTYNVIKAKTIYDYTFKDSIAIEVVEEKGF